MDEGILLNELQVLAKTMPDFAVYRAASHVHNRWLAKVIHYVTAWNEPQGRAIKGIGSYIGIELAREAHLSQLSTILHAEVDLEQRATARADKVFRKGEVYDIYKELRDLIKQCNVDLLIVDPWTDADVFDTYFSALGIRVRGRLLTFNFKADGKVALQRFNVQHGNQVEVRIATSRQAIHDRALFLDAASCYVCGQSLNHSAAKSPTYLMPLGGDAFDLKLSVYEDLWRNSPVA
jgi:hypothetical protein